MKKLFSSILVLFTTILMFGALSLNVSAEEDIIDMYPNDDINQLKGQYGNSNWVLDFAGYRYHTVSFMARFGQDFKGLSDDDKETWKSGDIPGVSANAMGGFIHNNSDRDVMLLDGDRSGLTGVINRIWAVFDEEGRLVVFEDHINAYYITEVEGEEHFRLSTESEIAEFEDAEEGEAPAHIRHSHIRMVLNDDNETYKAEPLGYLSWYHEDYVAPDADKDIEEQGSKSVIFDEERDPRGVMLNEGWTALHFSTWDRGKDVFNDLIELMPGLLASQEEKMELNFLNAAPEFINLTQRDVNAEESGVNFVYSVNSSPKVADLVAKDGSLEAVAARHQTAEEYLSKKYTYVDYVIRLKDEEGNEVETVDVTYDADAKKYVYEKEEFEELDTTEFGVRYLVEFEAKQPEYEDMETSNVTGDTTVVSGAIDVGVLPIHFTGVESRFLDEGLSIDLLEGITVYDNSRDLNNISESLTYEIVNTKTGSDHFNIWSAKAGTYQVTVKAEYIYGEEIDFDGDTTIEFGDTSVTVPADRINHDEDPFAYGKAGSLYTEVDKVDIDLFSTQGDKWGIYMALVDQTGKVVSYFDYDGKVMTFRNGTTKSIDAAQAKDPRVEWFNAMNFKSGDKLLVSSLPAGDIYAFLKGLEDGAELDGLGKAYLVEGETTYTLNVSDITPPRVTVKASTMTIHTDNSFKNAEEAAISNVDIFEEHGYNVVVPGSQRIDITVPGEHDIRVVVTDDSGNESEATFVLVVKEAKVSESEKDSLDDALADANDKIEELEDKLADAQKELKDANDKKASTTTVIVVALVSVVVSIGVSALLVFLRK